MTDTPPQVDLVTPQSVLDGEDIGVIRLETRDGHTALTMHILPASTWETINKNLHDLEDGA